MRGPIAVLLVLALGGACAGDHIGNPGDDCEFGAATQDVALYVCEGMPEGATGTREHPYPSIKDALAVARPDQAILLAEGTFSESVQIRAGVRLVGSGAGTVIAPVKGAGVVVEGADGVRLANLRVVGADTAGIAIRGGSVTVEDVVVEGTRAAEDGFGDGVVVVEGARVQLTRLRVTDSARHGIFVDGAHVHAIGGAVSASAEGGVKVQAGSANLLGVSVERNLQFGVAFLEASGQVSAGVIQGTAPDGDDRGGDGLVVVGAESAVEVTDMALSANARFGALVDRTHGVLLRGNQVVDNAGGGVWVQRGPADLGRVRMLGNTVLGNQRIGVVVTDGSRAELRSNTLAETRLGPLVADQMIGDGLGVYRGADALVDDNDISDSERVGAVFSEATGRFADNRVEEARAGLVRQLGAAVETRDNRFDGPGEGVVDLAAEDALGVLGAVQALP